MNRSLFLFWHLTQIEFAGLMSADRTGLSVELVPIE